MPKVYLKNDAIFLVKIFNVLTLHYKSHFQSRNLLQEKHLNSKNVGYYSNNKKNLHLKRLLFIKNVKVC